MSYQKYKETIKSTNEARRAAVRVLIDNHRQEFDEIYLVKAKERGLNPTKIASQVKKVELEKEIRAGLDTEMRPAVLITPEELSEIN